MDVQADAAANVAAAESRAEGAEADVDAEADAAANVGVVVVVAAGAVAACATLRKVGVFSSVFCVHFCRPPALHRCSLLIPVCSDCKTVRTLVPSYSPSGVCADIPKLLDTLKLEVSCL